MSPIAYYNILRRTREWRKKEHAVQKLENPLTMADKMSAGTLATIETTLVPTAVPTLAQELDSAAFDVSATNQ